MTITGLPASTLFRLENGQQSTTLAKFDAVLKRLKKTPHDVFLAWFTDMLDILKSNEIGFALWEFKGSFGVIDSERADVKYEDWHGSKLDRKLLDLLMKY